MILSNWCVLRIKGIYNKICKNVSVEWFKIAFGLNEMFAAENESFHFIYLLKSFFAHFAYENQYQDNEKRKKRNFSGKNAMHAILNIC